MSIRPDLLPSSFLFELQKLCDAVPSFPTQVMIIMMIRMMIKMMMMNDDDNYSRPRTPLPLLRQSSVSRSPPCSGGSNPAPAPSRPPPSGRSTGSSWQRRTRSWP